VLLFTLKLNFYFFAKQLILMMRSTVGRESLLKGKYQYCWPPCINKLRSSALHFLLKLYLFYRTTYLNEEVKCTEPSLSARIPCLQPPHLNVSKNNGLNYCNRTHLFSKIYAKKKKNRQLFNSPIVLKNVCLHQAATKWYTNGGEPKSALMSSFQL
jgi:hypothetical protein